MAGLSPYNHVLTQYKAVITQPISGLYTVTTSGTDVNLDPCTGSTASGGGAATSMVTPPAACDYLPTSMGAITNGITYEHLDAPSTYPISSSLL